jgi:glycosyltransferase involved in cell wall biosynthesis
MNPSVSILIPAYNAEAWIADTILSAIAQTWQRKEIIVVDDGSEDRTAEVARHFASKDVVVVSTGNQGAAAARNHALRLSQGDYIQWLDADDLLAPDQIERQLAAPKGANDSRVLLSSPWGYFNYRVHRARFVPTSLWQDLLPSLPNIAGPLRPSGQPWPAEAYSARGRSARRKRRTSTFA